MILFKFQLKTKFAENEFIGRIGCMYNDNLRSKVFVGLGSKERQSNGIFGMLPAWKSG